MTDKKITLSSPAQPGNEQHNKTSTGSSLFSNAQAEALSDTDTKHPDFDGDQLDLADRRSLIRVSGLSTELEDVTEVEYRQLRLEKVVLVGLQLDNAEDGQQTKDQAYNSLRELAALAETAGSQVMDGVIQKRHYPDPASYVGKGKAQEIKDIVVATGADTVIVDSELAPSQRRALEDIVRVKVVDRTALILDIFAQHAKSREGKAQVELAQLEYLLPRLRGWGQSMSRQAGGQAAGGQGIGSRGPGETKIELDRRRIRNRMAKLRKSIAAMEPSRQQKRYRRIVNHVPSVAIAGYTNAGKSSLLNRLTQAQSLVENALFATLDPTVRKSQTPDERDYTLSDTVGFVRSLPTQLVEAFRSTLEEIALSDVILHVVDGSHPDPASQITAVREVLNDVEADTIPEIIVLNKADIADPMMIDQIRHQEDNVVIISTRTGQGLEELQEKISELIPRPDIYIQAFFPYSEGKIVSEFYSQDATIESMTHTDEGTVVKALVSPALAHRVKDYIHV